MIEEGESVEDVARREAIEEATDSQTDQTGVKFPGKPGGHQ